MLPVRDEQRLPWDRSKRAEKRKKVNQTEDTHGAAKKPKEKFSATNLTKTSGERGVHGIDVLGCTLHLMTFLHVWALGDKILTPRNDTHANATQRQKEEASLNLWLAAYPIGDS